jgi:hypothetical protein
MLAVIVAPVTGNMAQLMTTSGALACLLDGRHVVLARWWRRLATSSVNAAIHRTAVEAAQPR